VAPGILALGLVRSRHRVAAGTWLVVVVLAVAGVVAASAASPALAQRVRIERLVRLSGASPFSGPCGASAIGQRGAEVEPSIAVLPCRVVLYVMTVEDDAPNAEDVMAARSVDGGRTWSRPGLIAHVNFNSPIDPDTDTVLAGTSGDALVRVGPDGVPTVAWSDLASPDASRVLVSRSRNAGRSWSSPGAVSNVRGEVFQASVTAVGDGTLGVTWRDDRRDPGGSAAWEFDVWFALWRDGGRSWRRSHLVGPFDMSRARALEGAGRRIGDYQGLAGLPHGFVAAFTQAPPQAKIAAFDVFLADVRPGTRPGR
jgi:hypothetical protein